MTAWSRFGFRAALAYAGYPERLEPFATELKRVGLEWTPIWTAQSVFDSVLLKAIRCSAMMKESSMNITLGHYRAVRAAYDMGRETVLVLENDVRFLRDVDEVERIVRELPDDFDIALFDWAVPKRATVEDCAKIVNGVVGRWARFECLRSCGCWALSRRGMEMWLEMVESAAKGGKLRVCDMYHGTMVTKGMKGYCAVPPACIQRKIGEVNTRYEVIRERYDRVGVELDKYAE